MYINALKYVFSEIDNENLYSVSMKINEGGI